ncbi:hypothetical protein D9M73_265530 [compost metagenome]
MRGHQHAVDPGPDVAVQRLAGLPLRAVETRLLAAGQEIASQAGAAFKHRQLAVLGELTQVVATAAQVQQAMFAEQLQWSRITGHSQLQFTFKQAHQALAGIKTDIGGAAGVELQLAAVVQGQAAPLADRAAVIGE